MNLIQRSFFSPSPGQCEDPCNCRTMWKILWSCVVTITACTWVALHPNVPNPRRNHPFIENVIRRTKMMLVALVAPEIIVTWSMKQLVVARRITKEYNRAPGDCEKSRHHYRWTLTHSFFAIMGGFVAAVPELPSSTPGEQHTAACPASDSSLSLYPTRRLSPHHLDVFIRGNRLTVTEEQLKDRSKGDLLAKVIVVLQTSWFIVVLGARVHQKLPVTELELITLAYAVLNIINYSCWMHKPLNVDCAILIPVSKSDGDQYLETTDRKSEYEPWEDLSIFSKMRRIFQILLDQLLFKMPFKRQIISGKYYKTKKEDVVVYERDMEYYYGHLDKWEHIWVSIACGIVAAFFGAVHAIAFSFTFPSYFEEVLWKFCSTIIIIAPFPVITIHLCIQADNLKQRFSWGTRKLFQLCIITILIIYIIARAVLLVLIFTTLRAPPKGVYTTVNWEKLYPHLF